MYSNGTHQAQQYIEKLKKNGDLIDIYSNEWLEKNYKDNKSIIKYIKKFEKKEGNEYIGHMLIIHLADESDEALNELLSLYKPLENIITKKSRSQHTGHNPDFLFINLYTKQILAAGLGRKNRIFLLDAETGNSIEYNTQALRISANDIFTNKNKSFYEEFIALDPLEVVTELISSLEELGSALFANASVRNRDEIEEILETSPDEDGYYFVGVSEYTKEELEEELEEIDRTTDSMYEAIETIQRYFPNASIGDLNTGDY